MISVKPQTFTKKSSRFKFLMSDEHNCIFTLRHIPKRRNRKQNIEILSNHLGVTIFLNVSMAGS